MREASQQSKELLRTLADITSKIVEWIINLAPFGILGLVYTTISGKGIEALKIYGMLLLLLLASMALVTLVVNPLIVFISSTDVLFTAVAEMSTCPRKNVIKQSAEAGTKVLASQLSLDCRARRSG